VEVGRLGGVVPYGALELSDVRAGGESPSRPCDHDRRDRVVIGETCQCRAERGPDGETDRVDRRIVDGNDGHAFAQRNCQRV
jgi:hypothetical protein